MGARRMAWMIAVLVVALGVLGSGTAVGQAVGYMSIESTALGLVTSLDLSTASVGDDLASEAHENQALLVSFSHQVLTSGTGDSHDSIVIVKPVSRSSPLLYRMMLTDDPATVVLHLYRISMTGTPEAYFAVTLLNARVVGVAPHVAGGGVGVTSTPHLESVAFSYGSITWQHLTCGTAYTATVVAPP